MKISNYLYMVIVLCLTFTIFTYAPFINKYWYFYFLAILLSFVNKTNNSKIFMPLMVYGIIVFLNTFIGDRVFQNYFISIIELASLFIPVSILLYLLGMKDKKGSYLIVYSFLVLTVFTTIVSLRINASNPGIIRNSTLYFRDDDVAFINAFYAMGLSNYFLPHGLCVLVPPLVLFVKESSGIRKYFDSISLIAVLTLVYISGSTTSLLLSVISLFLSLTLSKKNNQKKNYKILGWVLLLCSPLLISSDLQLYLFKIVSSIIGDSSIYQEKVSEFESVAITGTAGTDMKLRADLLYKSLTEFISNPLYGTSSAVGGHNALIDRLAALGLVGIIPLCVYFKRVYLWARPYIDNKIMPFVTLSLFNGLLLLLTKNMLCWDVLVILFLVMPIMFYSYTVDDIKGKSPNGKVTEHM